MTARVLRIEERHLQTPNHLASLDDFTYVEGDEVDPQVVVDDPDMSLYCLDDEGKRAIFTQLPPGVNLTKSPFVYLAQGEQAERLVVIPYDAFLKLGAGLPKVENLIPIYGTGRSGSTLMSHVFNELDTVMSLSEPDVANQFAYFRDADENRDAELCSLIDGAVRFLFKPTPHKKGATCALKFRAEGIRVIDLYGATFPQAKSLLLYRDAVGWVASFYRAFRNLGFPERPPLEQWVSYFGQGYKRTPGEVKAYLGEGEDVLLVKACTLWWLFLMEDCLRQHERGVRSLAVRYDDLNTHREEVLGKIFAYCGLPLAGVRKALRAFERDAQAGTMLARADPKRGNIQRLNEQQLADVYDVIERHPVINTPDFVLPGT